MANEKEYSTRDKPAERGITVNNALMTVLILISSAFGTLIIINMTDIKDSQKEMTSTLSKMQVFDGTSSEKFKHIDEHMKKCALWHEKHESRFYEYNQRIAEIERVTRINAQ